MINLIVAGGGEQTYKNLYKAILSKDPELGMRIAAVIEILPREKLHPETQRILDTEKARLLHPDDLQKFVPSKNSAGVIMTPHASHLWYAEFFASLGIPFYVEKPAVASMAELEEFLVLAKTHPNLVYAAEYCTDGKALALLDAGRVIPFDDPRRAYLDSSPDVAALYSDLGAIRSIRGTMLEGEGTAGTLEHRAWALDGKQGGMIRDLAPHLIGPLYDLGFAANPAKLRVTLGRYESGKPRGTWRPLENPDEGETYAKIEGIFSARSGSVNFQFELGKYWSKHDRLLELIFEHGNLKFSYEKPFEVVIKAGFSQAKSMLTADFYPTLAFLDFKRFIQGKTDGHIGRAAAIVTFNEHARQAGMREAGFC